MNGKYKVAAYSLPDTRFTLLTTSIVFSFMVVFSVAVCAKHHAFSNLQQNYSFIEGAIHQSRHLGLFG